MSKYVRSQKHKVHTGGTKAAAASASTSKPAGAVSVTIQASVRSPLSHAAVGLASMMLATTSAAAQDAATPRPAGEPAVSAPAPRPGAATDLPTITVRSAPRRPARRPAAAAAPAGAPIEVPAAPTSDYQAPPTSAIGRLGIAPLRNTPQTITVVPRPVIQDQRITSMEDALRTVPGITFQSGEGGQQGDGPIIRGFSARGDIFRDGIRDPGWYTRDLFNADRVEVYKGPSAFAFGRGSTGGAINTVTKLPTGADYVEGNISATTGPGYRLELDASGKKDDLQGRVVALATDFDTPTRDNINTKRYGIAPSVSRQMNQTKVTLSYIYQKEEGVPDYGFTYLPQPAFNRTNGQATSVGYNGNGTPVTPTPVSRSNWYGITNGPLKDWTDDETHIATLRTEHEFSKDTKLVNATRYMINNRYSLPTAPRNLLTATGAAVPPGYPVDLMTIGRERRVRQTDNTFLINQTDFLTKFTTGSLEHSLVTGIEFSRETRDQDRVDFCNPAAAACRTSLASPTNTGAPGNAEINNGPNMSIGKSQAAYVTDQVKVNKYWEFLGSLRFDRYEVQYTDFAQPANKFQERGDNMWSYRFGVVFHPTTNSSLYAAYGNSYNPSAELGTFAAGTALVAPENNKTVEAGFKVDVLKNQLSLTGAVFQVEKTNLRITDPVLTTISILDGVAQVQGFELGVAGNVTKQWKVFGGYSYLDSIVKDTRDLSILNRKVPQTPRHNFTLWTTYDFTDKWTAGFGAFYQDWAFGNAGNTAYIPEYWKFDAMLSYKFSKKSVVQLNIYNITDVFYYAQYQGNNVVPGSGRWASLSWRVKFEPEDWKKISGPDKPDTRRR